MKLKKFFVALALCALLANPVLAEEEAGEAAETVTTSAVAGVLPNSIWYSFDRFGEWFSSVLAFGASAEAEQCLDSANERLAEASKLVGLGEGNEEEIREDIDHALNAYEKEMRNLGELVKNTGEKLKESLDKTKLNFEKEIARVQISQQNALSNLYDADIGESNKALVENIRQNSFGIAREIVEKFVPKEFVPQLFSETIDEMDASGEIKKEESIEEMDDFFGNEFMKDFKLDMGKFMQDMKNFDPLKKGGFEAAGGIGVGGVGVGIGGIGVGSSAGE